LTLLRNETIKDFFKKCLRPYAILIILFCPLFISSLILELVWAHSEYRNFYIKNVFKILVCELIIITIGVVILCATGLAVAKVIGVYHFLFPQTVR